MAAIPNTGELRRAARDGAGMDRKLARRRVRPWKIVALALAAAGIAAAGWRFVDASRVRTLVLPADRATIATATLGSFEDFVPIRGNVTPRTTVYLDAIEGGRVENVLVEEGSIVQQGQPLVELSNTALNLDAISREAQVAEQLNNLRNTRLAMEQNRLALESSLVEIDYDVKRLSKLAARRKQLADRGLIARQDYEATADELEFQRERRKVTVESQQQDARMRLAQIASLESTVEQLQRNLAFARANLASLTIKAPIAGRLTSLEAKVGAAKKPAERLGQIDAVDDNKVTARVDEFYVTRVATGQSAEGEIDGRTYRLGVTKVYPEVRDGQFELDLEFAGETPPNVRRGQTLQLKLALGDRSKALLLARGPFADTTGGNWAFVLGADGKTAERRPIRLGRRNPEQFEVVDGLEPGDRVITSDYAGLETVDRLEIAR